MIPKATVRTLKKNIQESLLLNAVRGEFNPVVLDEWLNELDSNLALAEPEWYVKANKKALASEYERIKKAITRELADGAWIPKAVGRFGRTVLQKWVKTDLERLLDRRE